MRLGSPALASLYWTTVQSIIAPSPRTERMFVLARMPGGRPPYWTLVQLDFCARKRRISVIGAEGEIPLPPTGKGSPMNTTGHRLLAIAVGLAASVSTIAMAQAQGVIGNLAKNDSIFVDGKTFNVITGRSKADTDVRKLGARELGPGAIIFRSEDKLYISDASERVTAYLN